MVPSSKVSEFYLRLFASKVTVDVIEANVEIVSRFANVWIYRKQI